MDSRVRDGIPDGDASLVAAVLSEVAASADLAPAWRRCAHYWAGAIHPLLSAVSAQSIIWFLEDVHDSRRLPTDLTFRVEDARRCLAGAVIGRWAQGAAERTAIAVTGRRTTTEDGRCS